jgi:maltooligosyltrehalose trehalohydrolase
MDRLLKAKRRYPQGAELTPHGVSFRVWAPERHSVVAEIVGQEPVQLEPDGDGYFAAGVRGLGAGARYRFRLDGTAELFADPASRFQPDGWQSPSEVIDPAFDWTDREWRGLTRKGQVIYELHIGTFTPEGTWSAAIDRLRHLADVGITAIQLLPVPEWAGLFGWGYDGILPYAPTHAYGRPEDMRAFVDAAHALGIGVILDVVYNHFGAGDRFAEFTERYFKPGPRNDWGKSIWFDKQQAWGARDYFVANALYWIDEFHLDGFRIDATHAIEDDSEEHVLAEIIRKCREVASPRAVYIVGENEPQWNVILRDPADGGYGFDAAWNEDFHHSAIVAATGRQEAYRHDHAGAPQEFVSLAKYGFLFQGQRYDWQMKPRGTPVRDRSAEQFVHYLDNHDQVANNGGRRFHQLTSPARARVLMALQLLMPQTPTLFQGQEFAARTPFHYFLDSPLPGHVRDGRLEFLQQFQNRRDPEVLAALPDPSDRATFEASKLDWGDMDAGILALHRDLLRMRRDEPTFARQPTAHRGEIDGAVIGPEAFLLRYFAERPEDERLVVVNLGRDLPIRSIPDALFAPPAADLEWTEIWSSAMAG